MDAIKNTFLLALLCAALFAAVLASAPVQASPPKTSVEDVAQGLTCQCGCGLTVANCNHPNCSFSVPVREQIEQMIAKGFGKRDILAFFRQKYGEKILSAPDPHGFNLLAWLTPFIMLLAGAVALLLALRRWSRRTPSAPQTTVSPDHYEVRLRKQLESEVQRLL